MDKFLSSTWFVRLISFFLALMLFAVVSVEQNGTDALPLAGDGNDQSEVLRDVSVTPVYDDQKYVITGLPETVSVELEGPDNKIQKAKIQNSYRVFVDLRDKEPGTYTVPVQYSGFPEELEVQVNPSNVEVTIDEKVTETFPVQIDVLNEDKVAEGYEVGEPVSTPNQVTVTGAKDTVDQIAFVKGYVDVTGADDTIEERVPLNIYDKNGNELSIDGLSPPVVDVKVPITEPSKTVPLNLSREASLPDGLSIQSINIEPSKITLYGPEDVLKNIEFVEGSINLEEITEDTEIELEVSAPEGVNNIEPETATVSIEVAKQVTKTIEDVPIGLFGLSDDLEATFSVPADQKVDVIVKGSEKVLDQIEAGDIEAYINVSELSIGEHTVPIIVNGLQNIKSELQTEEAEIVVTEKDSSDGESQ